VADRYLTPGWVHATLTVSPGRHVAAHPLPLIAGSYTFSRIDRIKSAAPPVKETQRPGMDRKAGTTAR
jgi:hypothetical protein